mgnify:CR=1 FL=1
MVGIVVTISPSFNLYKIVVFPAASRPTEKRKKNLQIHVKILNQNLDLPIKIRICFLPKSRPNKLEMVNPIIYVQNSVKNCKNLFLNRQERNFQIRDRLRSFRFVESRNPQIFCENADLTVFQGDKKPKNNEFLSMCRCSQSTPLPTQL